MNKNRIYVFGLGAALLLGTAVLWWILAPVWRPLFSYQLPDDASLEVMQVLEAQGIEYKLQEQDGSILVRSGDISVAHRVLGENGLPKKAGDGLEVFGNSDYGLSEFAQNINYQRGVEEELARTILRMQGIRDVRVHLTIKKGSLFEDRKQEPKASVVLGFKEGVVYGPEKIRGIQEIISAAVPNLAPKAVTIITDQGLVLSASDSVAFIDGKSVEEKYRLVLAELLDGLLGSGKYKLAVNVQMDLTKKTTLQEKIVPGSESGKGFLVRSKSTSRSDEPSTGNRSGVLQTSAEDEFVFSREKSEIVYATGKVANISVGLVVFAAAQPDLQSSIESLVSAALAMDLQRGDKLSIVFTGKTPDASVDAAYFAGGQDIGSNELAMSAAGSRSAYYLQYFLGVLCLVMSTLTVSLYVKLRRRERFTMSSAEKEMLAADIINWLGSGK